MLVHRKKQQTEDNSSIRLKKNGSTNSLRGSFYLLFTLKILEFTILKKLNVSKKSTIFQVCGLFYSLNFLLFVFLFLLNQAVACPKTRES